VIGIGGGDYPSAQGNTAATKAFGISCAVIALLVVKDKGHHIHELRSLFYDAFSQYGMAAYALPFLLRQAAFFGEDRIRHTDFAHIVKQGRDPYT
jgi:hypothetical protein